MKAAKGILLVGLICPKHKGKAASEINIDRAREDDYTYMWLQSENYKIILILERTEEQVYMQKLL